MIVSARIATTDGSKLRIALTDGANQALATPWPATADFPCFNLADYRPDGVFAASLASQLKLVVTCQKRAVQLPRPL
jgi:hypothetical protein